MANKVIEKYMDGVGSGKVVACKTTKQSIARFRSDLKTAEKKGLVFDEEAGEHAVKFFSYLRHSKGEWAGKPFDLAPWQQFIVSQLFGWKRKKDGLRRFRTAYIEVPRKNGKSTLAAGVGLYMMIGDGEPGAEVYSAATKRDQAKIVWGEAKRMVVNSPEIKKIVTAHISNLHIVNTASKFEPLGRDADSTDGLNIHCAIVDELHAHDSRDLWDVLKTGMGARRQPLLFAITTAGYNREGICYQQKRYAERILAGEIKNDAYFSFITSLDDGDDWRDKKTWAKANPNLGISLNVDDMKLQCKEARELPGEQNAFLCKRLNVWTEQAERWINMEVWSKCNLPGSSIGQLPGLPCYAGLDLSSKIDLSSLVLLFPPQESSDAWSVLPFFWIPEDSMRERVRRDAVPYDQWVNEGYIKTTPGNVIDYDYIRKEVNELGEIYKFQEIGFDDWGATQLTIQLDGDGFTMVPVRQGYKTLSPASKDLERLYIGQKLNHFGNPVLNWMARNVAIMRDPADNIKPAKNKSEEKIDGIVALVMALSRGMVALDFDSGKSIYDEAGAFYL